MLAQQLFPGGIEIKFDGVPLDEQIKHTKNAISQGVATLYEAAFIHGTVISSDGGRFDKL